ncbi:MAG: hypothetical protein EOP45_07760 [Sphingobacteriaceae bacterium]|nr:MAG: hypothetical protein EOP45_07760 [Sphingobacteriaceae bacterium]
MRNKYWVICGKQAIRSKINSCVPCFRQRKATQQQLMGDLPDFRVTPGRPFQKTAVDYAGPVFLKRYNAQRTKIVDKGYIAVFVCTRTRAVHLELVSNLTSEAFMAAFIRFSSRRGRIHEMLADNGTTFHGPEEK